MTFKKDLDFGNKYEKELLNHLEYKTIKIMKGNFKPYDIIMDNKVKFEVKADRWTNKTNNFCIEYKCRGKPSGITTTESDFYGYFEIINDDKLLYNLYLIPTKYIKSVIESKKYHRKIRGGDSCASCFYLFNKSIFKKYLKK